MTSPPITRPPVPVLDEEVMAPPRTAGPLTEKLGPKRPAPPNNRGVGEIKPHTEAGIHAGLAQLVQPGATGPRLLITYRIHPDDENRCTLYVLEPKADVLQPRTVKRRGRKPVVVATLPRMVVDRGAWLDLLGDWYRIEPDVSLDKIRMSAPEWRRHVGPVVFGSMLEPLVRMRFLQVYKASRSGGTKLPHQAGHDVSWQELENYVDASFG